MIRRLTEYFRNLNEALDRVLSSDSRPSMGEFRKPISDPQEPSDELVGISGPQSGGYGGGE